MLLGGQGRGRHGVRRSVPRGILGLLLVAALVPVFGMERPTTPPTRPAPPPEEPAPPEPGVRPDPSAHIDLSRMASAMNLERRWDAPNRSMVLTSSGGGNLRLRFEGASRAFRFNGMRLFLGEAVQPGSETLYLSLIDYRTMVRPLLAPGSEPAPGGALRTIAIDAGHGGRDPGTQNRELGLSEKDMTLDVALRLRDILQAEGFRVVLTRRDDRYVSLERRAAIANGARADLFLSIHFNAVENPSVNGIETFLLTPRHHRSTGQNERRMTDDRVHPGNRFDHWNTLLAFYTQRQLLHDLGAFDRGIKRARFSVLREVDCPAILVEAGYLSNTREARRIGTPEYRQQIARSLASAVNHYRTTWNRISE